MTATIVDLRAGRRLAPIAVAAPDPAVWPLCACGDAQHALEDVHVTFDDEVPGRPLAVDGLAGLLAHNSAAKGTKWWLALSRTVTTGDHLAIRATASHIIAGATKYKPIPTAGPLVYWQFVAVHQ